MVLRIPISMVPPPPPPMINLAKMKKIMRKNTCDIRISQKEYFPLKWNCLRDKNGNTDNLGNFMK